MVVDSFTDNFLNLSRIFVQGHFEVASGSVGHDEPGQVEPGRHLAVPAGLLFPLGLFFKFPGLAQVAEESADPQPVRNY